jgi:oxygen-independent coproporphyrinogen-3 oxidase
MPQNEHNSENVGIYLHFPYCVHKCSYCDFYSIEKLNSRKLFAETAAKEIKLRTSQRNRKLKADTIFFGGGTPSLLKPEQLANIYTALDENYNLSELKEWTMECNPGTIDSKYLEDYKSFGVNRISFGVQSFNESELKFLERIHDEKQIYKAIDKARNAGFDNISLDLIYAIPGQTQESWNETLQKALSLRTDHISAYSLIYEPETPLYTIYERGELNVHSEESDEDFYRTAVEAFHKEGYEHYEISNFAKKGKKCLHNLKYWRSENYDAYGPSAHGLFNGHRYWNFRDLNKYFELLDKDILPIENSEILTEEQQMNEFLYLELRSEGLRFDVFSEKFGFDLLHSSQNYMKNLIQAGYAEFNNSILRLTWRGYFISDKITLEFMNIASKN